MAAGPGQRPGARHDRSRTAGPLPRCGLADRRARQRSAGQPRITDATLCLGFVQGVGDAGLLLGELDSEDVAALRNCRPKRTAAEEIVRLVTRHLEERPEDANLPGAAVVLITLHDAFPCDV